MIVTISRQTGSQGREIGRALADNLSVDFYDKNLIALASKKSGISIEQFERYDENASNSLLYTLSIGASAAVNTDYGNMPDVPVSDKIYLVQYDIIRQAAEQPCVIVGRCADHILSDRKDCAKIFIYADIALRTAHIAKHLGISEDKAKSIVRKTDKSRANYYNYFADGKWGDPSHYDLCLNSGTLSVQGCAALIKAYLQQRGIL